jgi:hypothetical protein
MLVILLGVKCDATADGNACSNIARRLKDQLSPPIDTLDSIAIPSTFEQSGLIISMFYSVIGHGTAT